MVTSEIDLNSKIDEFCQRLRSAFAVEAIVLFGSHARGEAREWSDIDLAVISPDFEGLSQWERQDFMARCTVGRPYRIAPIGYASGEYHDPGPHSFLREIIRTGKVVYQAKAD
jgi:hypothetical protein